ncbi:transporter, SSS family [Chitinophaga terrae (ex Kim and Jung 2007)]|uniref:Transporter, SSS family n=1 Tax=Chitinophaga terrae (ex Kim and Jung 2007) TaxID=408074 RepID=A0A1H3YJW1_9BACT|nr:sodium:solute symporter family protein [Chitinophaga terrae (ex Kim and Jung 2007)]GEP88363.1 sodium-coupled permease [Chitinophaga terrae (ex Kim and Jung 2007)]SEA11866.1 transporter, SSS family [Chitinophaga terrae (ex Kim and Jung 2007)]
MAQLDFIVMAVFALLVLGIGMLFTRIGSKNSSAFFEAGGATPWWINSISLFISYFSAGTFVVWGSIAYKSGFVANGIQLTMVFGGVLVALFIAARWKRTGAVTAAEYIGKRLGTGTQKFYTFLIMLHGLFTTASVLYPVGKMVSVATPLSLNTCILIIGGVIVLYTSAGGLWAVLVTDVVQFVILTAAVVIVIPMALQEAGGMHAFVDKAPDGFFNFFNSEYSFGFFLAFLAYQTVYIGGNWAYVQRYTSVSSERNSKKVAWLFTLLYLVSPFIWMLPPMLYRVINPTLTGLQPEGAYMMLCQQVLPAGLIGLVLSGMISASASKANTTINIMAVVFAHDVYKKVLNRHASEKALVRAARFFTVFFGGVTIGIAMLVPLIGGIVEMVLSTASIAGGALFAPIIWTLYSRRQTAVSVVTASVCGLVISLGLKLMGPKLDRVWETALGVGIPIVVLLLWEVYYFIKKEEVAPELLQSSPSAATHTVEQQGDARTQNQFGMRVIAAAIAIVGGGIAVLGWVAVGGRVALITGLVIALCSWPLFRAAKGIK